MVPSSSRIDDRGRERVVSRSLYTSLYYATQVIEDIANGLNSEYLCQRRLNRQRGGHDFSVSRARCERESGTMIDVARSWLQSHEDAQVMLASVLVVVGLWWLVRTVLGLLINLVCPLLVVVLAVVCVPQLRAPLLGQNYPVLANLLRNILIKMAETLKS
ncbi:uncharacterized protein LOC142981193 isoform X2 [Anticarsia gemmatalis]|uniref:uncharacterized protein LOC142981193 isoform X2 n=1 Tax=Anticarsia gemmatalis TaxID=129554 RepID=UPI003F75F32C